MTMIWCDFVWCRSGCSGSPADSPWHCTVDVLHRHTHLCREWPQ